MVTLLVDQVASRSVRFTASLQNLHMICVFWVGCHPHFVDAISVIFSKQIVHFILSISGDRGDRSSLSSESGSDTACIAWGLTCSISLRRVISAKVGSSRHRRHW